MDRIDMLSEQLNRMEGKMDMIVRLEERVKVLERALGVFQKIQVAVLIALVVKVFVG